MKQTTGVIRSEKGFYIGDICYVLNREIYAKVWGGAEYADGKYVVPGTSREFIVARTAWLHFTGKEDLISYIKKNKDKLIWKKERE